jgi:hypothetical protein
MKEQPRHLTLAHYFLLFHGTLKQVNLSQRPEVNLRCCKRVRQ